MRRVVTLTVATAGLVVGLASAASADPKGDVFSLTCGGATYEIVVAGNGQWTPAHVIGSTEIFVPVTIGDFTFEAELPTGEVIEASLPGFEAKGNGNAAGPQEDQTCTFTASETLAEAVVDPDFGELPAGTTVTFSGVVTGFFTGGPA
ncbi:hypothetical protein ACI797_10775 [Geodermatophilus sp. SYSU D00691]